MKDKELLESKSNTTEKESEDNVCLPESAEVHPLTLTLPTNTIVDKVKEATTKEELQELEDIFSIAITKNEIARMAKQDELLDLVLNQAANRIRQNPGNLSTKDLLDYMNALQNNLDRSHKNIKPQNNDEPINQINNVHNEVTVNMTGDSLTRDSQNKVMDVVKAILQQAKEPETVNEEVSQSTVEEEIDKETEEKGVNNND